MKYLSRENILFQSQVYPDENHALFSVKPHLYGTMENFINDCFDLDSGVDDVVGLRRRRQSRRRSSTSTQLHGSDQNNNQLHGTSGRGPTGPNAWDALMQHG